MQKNCMVKENIKICIDIDNITPRCANYKYINILYLSICWEYKHPKFINMLSLIHFISDK